MTGFGTPEHDDSKESNDSSSLVPCFYCGSSSYAPLYQGVRDRLRYVEGTWDFVRCTDCGSALLWPQPDPSDLPSYYPPVYSFLPDLEKSSKLKRWLNALEYRVFYRPQYREQVRRVLSVIGKRPSHVPRLLDVGCGRGLRLLAFRELGFDCTGMDFQPQAVEDVRQRLGIPAVCCDIDSLTENFIPESFDVITAFFLLEHVPNVAQVLDLCHSLLKPGGWFVAAVPLVDTPLCSLFGKRWIEVAEAPRHLSLPTRSGIQRAYNRSGYEQFAMRPDASLTCAGQIALSLLPESASTHTYGTHGIWPFCTRLLSGVLMLISVPLVSVQNTIFRRPSSAMFFGQKPFVGKVDVSPALESVTGRDSENGISHRHVADQHL